MELRPSNDDQLWLDLVVDVQDVPQVLGNEPVSVLRVRLRTKFAQERPERQPLALAECGSAAHDSQPGVAKMRSAVNPMLDDMHR
jgi:hypothetical protein